MSDPSTEINFSGTPLSMMELIVGKSTPGEDFLASAADSLGGESPQIKTLCHFSCKWCGKLAKEPAINVICGHLFCWRCIYLWWAPSGTSDQVRRRYCPFCKLHLDIAASMSTIVPVYSGPEPGVEFRIYEDPEPELDEEEEEKRMNAILKEGKQYVPARPAWNTGSMHPSKTDLIVHLLFRVSSVKIRQKNYLKWKRPGGFGFDKVFIEIKEMIQYLKDAWQWLTGKEYTEVSCEMESPTKSERMKLEKIVLVPTDAEFSDISTFSCKICNKIAIEPVVTKCGHLFCWICLWGEIREVDSCPVCEVDVNVFTSRADFNSIYCMADSSEEDDFFKFNRKDLHEKETRAPCRPNQNVAVLFLDYTIKKVTEYGEEMIKCLKDTQSEFADKISETNAIWDRLYVDVVKNWRNYSGEHVEERLVIPTLLEVKCEVITVQEGANTIRKLEGYLVDMLGDASTIDYFTCFEMTSMGTSVYSIQLCIEHVHIAM